MYEQHESAIIEKVHVVGTPPLLFSIEIKLKKSESVSCSNFIFYLPINDFDSY